MKLKTDLKKGIYNVLILALGAITIGIVVSGDLFFRIAIFINIALLGCFKWTDEEREPGLKRLRQFKSISKRRT
jgi:hypothetical protein